MEARWNKGATTTSVGTMRRLFTPTESRYVSYGVKYSANYEGSGQAYHPHEFTVLSSRDGDFDGPFNYLNTYIEQNYQNGGANPTLKFKQRFFSPYIGDGTPVAQTMWVDDLTVATARPEPENVTPDTVAAPVRPHLSGAAQSKAAERR